MNANDTANTATANAAPAAAPAHSYVQDPALVAKWETEARLGLNRRPGEIVIHRTNTAAAPAIVLEVIVRNTPAGKRASLKLAMLESSAERGHVEATLPGSCVSDVPDFYLVEVFGDEHLEKLRKVFEEYSAFVAAELSAA